LHRLFLALQFSALATCSYTDSASGISVSSPASANPPHVRSVGQPVATKYRAAEGLESYFTVGRNAVALPQSRTLPEYLRAAPRQVCWGGGT